MSKKLLENALNAIISGDEEKASKLMNRFISEKTANIYSSLSAKKDILDESWLASLYEEDEEEISLDDEKTDELADLVGDEEEMSDEEMSDEETEETEEVPSDTDDKLDKILDMLSELVGEEKSEDEDENVKESDEDFVGRIDHSDTDESCNEDETCEEIDDEMLEALAESVMSELTKVTVTNKSNKSGPSPMLQRGIKDRVGGKPVRLERGSDGKLPSPKMARITAKNVRQKATSDLSTVKVANNKTSADGKSVIAGKK